MDGGFWMGESAVADVVDHVHGPFFAQHLVDYLHTEDIAVLAEVDSRGMARNQSQVAGLLKKKYNSINSFYL